MPEDPYVYPGTNVLRNHFGVRDATELQRRETAAATLAGARLAHQRLPGNYDLAHLQAFHQRLFASVYPWAGEVRTVAIAKADMFALPQHVESYLGGVLAELPRENYLRGLDRDRTVDRLTHYLAEINASHPFREGNGRTQRAFLGQLARDAGYELDWSRVDAERNIDASIASMRGNNQRLRALLDDITREARSAEQQRDPTSPTAEPSRSPPHLADSWRALLGEQRAARLQQRAQALAPDLSGRPTAELIAERDAGRGAFAQLNAAAASQAARLEAEGQAAADRAQTARHRQHDVEAQLRHATRRQARHLAHVADTTGASAERAERERAQTAGQLAALREHGIHPDQWLDAHGETAARAIAAGDALDHRHDHQAATDTASPMHEPQRRPAAREQVERAEAPEIVETYDAGYEL